MSDSIGGSPVPQICIAMEFPCDSNVRVEAWIEFSRSTIDDARAEVERVLETFAISVSDTGTWSIVEQEGFGDLELQSADRLEYLAGLAALIATHGEVAVNLTRYLPNPSDLGRLTWLLEERYSGCAPDLKTWCEHYFDHQGGLEDVPERFHSYIDTERYAHDLLRDGSIFTVDTADGLHVF